MGLFRFFGSAQSDEQDKNGAETESAALDQQQDAPSDEHVPPTFDAVAVLEEAGVDENHRERVERTLELLRAMPADAAPQLRRGIVEASLKAFDISIKAIVESAGAEVAAFDAYIASGHKELEELRRQSDNRIAQLEAEIAKIRHRLEVATSDQAHLDSETHAAIERVRPVLGFFSEAPPMPRGAANDSKADPQPSIIVDESLMKTG